MHRLGGWLIVAALLVMGCSKGQPSGRPDIDAIPEVELRSAATKAALYEFQAKVRKRGAQAAKQELPDLIEGLEGYEKLKLGEHKETYKQIVEKLKAMQGSVATASKEAAIKDADEIGALADKLPGKAEKNPKVE